VRYEVDVEPGLPRVRARAGELKEVLLNLLENARAALEGSGAVRVSASRGAEAIELAVADDGKGIAPELLTKVFDPHFSTRSSGTGLGLAIVRRLVDSWGGSVWAESEPGRGTTVRVRMAVAEGGPAPRLQISGGSGN
jgi:signal transduction histidine kinase